MEFAEKTRRKVKDYTFSGVGHKTASFGVASTSGEMSIESLTTQADAALYQSKNEGRNRVTALQ